MIFLPLVVLGLVGTAGVVQSRRSRPVDPGTLAQRQCIYETAINEIKNPQKLRELAAVFRSQGHAAEADMLEKRARLQELPPEVKEQRREVMRKLLASTDIEKICQGANIFEQEGSTGVALQLRKYAAGLAAASTQTPTEGDTNE